jgi:HEPN domain-containing protein
MVGRSRAAIPLAGESLAVVVKLDNYARDWRLWRNWAAIDHRAATTLFDSGDPFLFFPAATLGHHALEMYLKSALILNGMTVFDPKKVKLLDAGAKLAKQDCTWGHDLIQLAEELARRKPEFELSKQWTLWAM